MINRDYVVWNWIESIQKLINEENNNPKRSKSIEWKINPMKKIKIDEELELTILREWYKLEDKLENWKKIFVRKNWNISTWWIPVDITDIVNEEIKEICLKLCRDCWLKVCWIDIVTTDISKPLKRSNWAVIEINSWPWIRMHHYPSKWKVINVAKKNIRISFYSKRISKKK